jgi:hypothetical protein
MVMKHVGFSIVLVLVFVYLVTFAVLRIELRATYMLDKHSTTGLHPQLRNFII